MRKSKSPLHKKNKTSQSDTEKIKAQIETNIKLLTDQSKKLEKSNLEKMSQIKTNQQDLKKLLNNSKEENRTFLARLKVAVNNNNRSTSVFTIRDPFIKKNLKKIKEILDKKGFKFPSKSKSIKNTSNRSIGSNNSFYNKFNGSIKSIKSNTSREKLKMDKIANGETKGGVRDLWVLGKYEKNGYKEFSSNLRAIYYAKLLKSDK